MCEVDIVNETPDDMENQKTTDFRKKLFKEKEAKTSGFVAAIIVNIIVLYVVNNILSWNLGFIAPSFQDVLWIFNLSIAATIIANIIFLVYHPGWFRSILQIILNILGFLVCYYLYTIFPFTFSQAAYTLVLQIILILGMIAVVIATVYEVVRLIVGIKSE
jgi:hypothetical protein